MCASAGEPLPAPLQRRFTDRFGVEILDGIGSTEALHIFLSNRPGDIRPGTTGLAGPGLRRRGPRRRRAAWSPDGEPGALHVRGESIALGYWHRTDASRQVFQGEWLVTGDTYVRDDEGYYTCLGRNSDMLKAGGIWVSPGRGGEPAAGAPGGARGRRGRRAPTRDGLDKPVAVVVVAERRRTRTTWWPGAATGSRTSRRRARWCSSTTCPKTATGKLQRFKVRDLVGRDPAAEPDPRSRRARSGTVSA